MAILDFQTLQDAVKTDGAAIRVITRLEPAGGQGSKVFPATYPGPNGPYIFEVRRINGAEVNCVLLDSVQSQANRMEEALLEGRRQNRIEFPDVEVDFASAGLPQYGRLSVLQVPHRLADAIFRDSYLNKDLFRQSKPGQDFARSSPQNATRVLEIAPACLVFGVWNSAALGQGGLGTRFARVLVSEIVGVSAQEGQVAAVRVDPLGIQREAATIYEADNPFGWTLDPEKAKRDGSGEPKKYGEDKGRPGGRPSNINHGNIIKDIGIGGVTIDYALQTTVVSLSGLRKLCFPDASGKRTDQRDLAARTYLATLALCAIEFQQKSGYDLRSRCLLYPIERRVELIPNVPRAPKEVDLSIEVALQLNKEAVQRLKEAGFSWNCQPLTLRPSDELIELIRRNEAVIAAGQNEEE